MLLGSVLGLQVMVLMIDALGMVLVTDAFGIMLVIDGFGMELMIDASPPLGPECEMTEGERMVGNFYSAGKTDTPEECQDICRYSNSRLMLYK